MKASFSAFFLSLFLASKNLVFAQGTETATTTSATATTGTGTPTTTTTGTGGASGTAQAGAAATTPAKAPEACDKDGFSYAALSASILGSTMFVLA